MTALSYVDQSSLPAEGPLGSDAETWDRGRAKRDSLTEVASGEREVAPVWSKLGEASDVDLATGSGVPVVLPPDHSVRQNDDDLWGEAGHEGGFGPEPRTLGRGSLLGSVGALTIGAALVVAVLLPAAPPPPSTRGLPRQTTENQSQAPSAGAPLPAYSSSFPSALESPVPASSSSLLPMPTPSATSVVTKTRPAAARPSKKPAASNPGWAPSDGTMLTLSDNGELYVVAGGAPLFVRTWENVGGKMPTLTVTRMALSKMRKFPKDGTVVQFQGLGVYRFAGGAPVYVSSLPAINNAPATVVADRALLDTPTGSRPFDHVRRYPLDGTIVRTIAGDVYRFAGGAPLYVKNLNSIGNPKPVTVLDQVGLDRAGEPLPYFGVRRYPIDGTKLRAGTTGAYYVVRGGRPIRVAWASDAVIVDPAAIANRGTGDVWNRLRK